MNWDNSKNWILGHVRVLTYATGSILIVIWTLLRFFTARTIFDLIGQQVLANQWLHGYTSGSSVGVTNYIPKMFLLYMPLDLLPGSPRLKLIILTLLVNLVTFILLGVIVEKLLRYFGIKPGLLFYGALLWFAGIAGSVFWIQFTNSRNLEVVGGMFLVYQVLLYLKKPSSGRLIGLAAFCSLLFFADTLQLYMIGLPLVLYGLLTVPRTKAGLRIVGGVIIMLAVGFVGSKVLFELTQHALSVSILRPGNPHVGLALVQRVTGTLKSFVHLLAGAADAGNLREVANLAFLIACVAGFGYAVWRRFIPRKLALLVCLTLLVDAAVYAASGQALQHGTERYLIMTAPILVLAIGALQRRAVRVLPSVAISGTILLLLLVNMLSLAIALSRHWDTKFPQDTHLASVQRYVAQHPGTVLYGSMDSSLPTAFLIGSATYDLLPLSCDGNQLFKSQTFYDRATFDSIEQSKSDMASIILDGTAITNTPSVCSQQLIIEQLGQPTGVATTDDGSVVLQYNPTVLKRVLHY